MSAAPPSAAPEFRELTLSAQGVTVRFLTLGSTLRDLRLDGIEHSLTVSPADPARYLTDMRYTGAIVGPVANRISHGQAILEGQPLTLPTNEGTTCLHGGSKGLDLQVWEVAHHSTDQLDLVLSLDHLEDGWPGKRQIRASWKIPARNCLSLELTATTDRPTLFGPSQHSYWRLGPGEDLRHHSLICDAAQYTAVDDAGIPTGDLPQTAGTAYDFRTGAPVGPEAVQRIDHNLCLSHAPVPLRPLCRLIGPSATLTFSGTDPGLQVYDATHFGPLGCPDLDGRIIPALAGLALEPQHWPDACKHPGWTAPLLMPGQTFRQQMLWEFTPA